MCDSIFAILFPSVCSGSREGRQRTKRSIARRIPTQRNPAIPLRRVPPILRSFSLPASVHTRTDAYVRTFVLRAFVTYFPSVRRTCVSSVPLRSSVHRRSSVSRSQPVLAVPSVRRSVARSFVHASTACILAVGSVGRCSFHRSIDLFVVCRSVSLAAVGNERTTERHCERTNRRT